MQPGHPRDRRFGSVGQLALVQERERRRIARGLHDVVGHPLALARLQLAQLIASERSDERRAALSQVAELLGRAVEETRSLTFELSSLALCELGLEPALQGLGERIAGHQGLCFVWRSDGEPKPLGEDAETILYRVAEELLVNAAKHARSRSVGVSVARERDRVRVCVEDDGVGFDPVLAEPRLGGLGLPGVRQLLDSFGGRLEIDSSPGAGSRVSALVPIRSDPS